MQINISKSEYHGGHFEGNECGKIFKNINKLEEHIKKHDESCLPFVDTVWYIKLLDELVNKPELEKEYKEVIEAFRVSFVNFMKSFFLTMPNKVHIIIHHLPKYLEETQLTLIKTTDQTVEATHSKLDSFLKQHGYFRKNMDGPDSGKKIT